MSDSDAVQYEVADEVATVTLNNPDMRNALTADVSDGLVDALDAIQDTDARCVVIEGAGSAFSAGGDVDLMMEGLSSDVPPHEKAEAVMNGLHRAIERLVRFPLPTVARVDGQAFGAGASLAIACDIQVARADAELSFAFRKVGLAVDSGTSVLLPRMVGENMAKRLVFTGQVLSAEEAADVGVVTDVYDEAEYDAEFDALVESIASGPTAGLKVSKRLIRQNATKGLVEALDDEAAGQSLLFDSADHEEGARAFMEGRRPEFEGN